MSTYSHCPDCTNQLTHQHNQCSCGWKNLTIKKVVRFRCQYMEKQYRCEKEGTISNQVRGDVWYCREHYNK